MYEYSPEHVAYRYTLKGLVYGGNVAKCEKDIYQRGQMKLVII